MMAITHDPVLAGILPRLNKIFHIELPGAANERTKSLYTSAVRKSMIEVAQKQLADTNQIEAQALAALRRWKHVATPGQAGVVATLLKSDTPAAAKAKKPDEPQKKLKGGTDDAQAALAMFAA